MIARFRARLNALEARYPRAYVIALVLVLDVAIIAALSVSRLFPAS